MDRLRMLINFVVGVVVVGIGVNLISDYVGNRYHAAEKPLIEIASIAILAWAVLVLGNILFAKFTTGRYAVEALILNNQNELLMWWHPFHRVMLPPGGRVKRSEFPNDALQLRLQERLDLNPRQYRFDERFHHGIHNTTGNLGEIQRLAAPFLVQRELHKQRFFVKFHYDFIYVLKLITDEDVTGGDTRYQPVRFVDMDALKEMVAQMRTYPDVLDAYRRVLDTISRAAP